MNLVDSTTQPLPPLGGATPTVPLSIEATLTHGILAENIPSADEHPFEYPFGIFLNSTEISHNHQSGRELFTFESRGFLKQLNLLQTFDAEFGRVNGFMPWSLIKPFYSKTVRMEYFVRLIPVKVADCRARIDILSRFDGTEANYETKAYQQPNVHFSLDDPSDQIDFCFPQVYVSNTIPTDKMNMAGSPQYSYLMPKTVSTAILTTPYTPNSIQPTNMQLLAIVYPLALDAQAITVKRTILAADGAVQMLKPYFL